MRTFTCSTCHLLVFFENTACLRCGSALGYDHGTREMITLPDGLDADPDWFRCANAEVAACNWLVRTPGELCASCSLTRTRPADSDPSGLQDLGVAEAAKRRLLFELAELGLPVEGAGEREGGLVFDLLSSEAVPVTTGHAGGVITLDLAEADDSDRAARREQLGEPYRTVLGHFRHEIGHYYWPLLVESDPETLADHRALFGDEREDYQAALERHYASGPPADWHLHHVSAYAAMHPWEDWAETWAHYLHISASTQTAAAYGLRTPLAEPEPAPDDFRTVIDAWIPFTIAMNAINLSMGRNPLYPFVLTAAVIEKLEFVDRTVRRVRSAVPTA
ncbi:putative zinc-binding metallopeptidase [Paraconexibacter sp.]|uniref:zinc-binding metallopeptidase family protein n=1 Tax=Paraconexibacter sp. TaxID=2949640 RepID=UPI0035624445